MVHLPTFLAQMEGVEDRLPEVPNFITLFHNRFHDVSWVDFLHQWENVIFSFIIATVISIFFYIGTRKREMIPTGLQNFLEYGVEYFRKFIIEILGPRGERYVPFLGTLFIYILTMNLMGIVPFMKSPSASLNITVALALCVFGLVQYLNIKHMGFAGFIYHLAGSPKSALEWAMVPLMFPIEVLTQLTRPLTLALRLFGNVLGEDVLMGAFALFGIALLAGINSPVGVPLQLPFMFMALLFSAMQALVFTLLSTIYILLAMGHEEKH